jgi:hypothetical protein
MGIAVTDKRKQHHYADIYAVIGWHRQSWPMRFGYAFQPGYPRSMRYD